MARGRTTPSTYAASLQVLVFLHLHTPTPLSIVAKLSRPHTAYNLSIDPFFPTTPPPSEKPWCKPPKALTHDSWQFLTLMQSLFQNIYCALRNYIPASSSVGINKLLIAVSR